MFASGVGTLEGLKVGKLADWQIRNSEIGIMILERKVAMTVHTSVYTKTSRQISRLAELYEKRQVSDLTAQTLNKLVDLEISQTEIQLREIERDLAEYEKQHGMSSHEFFEKYESGQTDDRMDFVEWASLTQMADDLRQHLSLLTSEGE